MKLHVPVIIKASQTGCMRSLLSLLKEASRGTKAAGKNHSRNTETKSGDQRTTQARRTRKKRSHIVAKQVDEPESQS